ncbi:MAG: hypothetical protein JJ975_07760 [Bacteroidia bacterium]|nr:hypothetical protein [Bacteroidia bacterium]
MQEGKEKLLKESLVHPEYHFDVKLFYAINEPDLCREYLRQHRKVLEDYGIKNVSSNKDTWMHNPHVLCAVIVEPATGEMVGGVRVQRASKDFDLPIEKAIGRLDYKLLIDINKHAPKVVAELCGLWTSNKVRGYGLSTPLTRFGIHMLQKIDTNWCLCLCAQYTKYLVKRHGFQEDERYGKKGKFDYPDDRYIASVMSLTPEMKDPSFISEKKLMEDLRNHISTSREMISCHFLKFNIESCLDV